MSSSSSSDACLPSALRLRSVSSLHPLRMSFLRRQDLTRPMSDASVTRTHSDMSSSCSSLQPTRFISPESVSCEHLERDSIRIRGHPRVVWSGRSLLAASSQSRLSLSRTCTRGPMFHTASEPTCGHLDKLRAVRFELVRTTLTTASSVSLGRLPTSSITSRLLPTTAAKQSSDSLGHSRTLKSTSLRALSISRVTAKSVTPSQPLSQTLSSCSRFFTRLITPCSPTAERRRSTCCSCGQLFATYLIE
mmetsp:Transcript_25916/g.85317  ORF Transcript_25916/g.85317 Transcript_25916/m.85317 type:complete len:248 (+) Transcript_25916:422-1165(+)